MVTQWVVPILRKLSQFLALIIVRKAAGTSYEKSISCLRQFLTIKVIINPID